MTHALFTGPIRGDVTLADGTVVDVRPDMIYLDTHEQAIEAAVLISQRFAEEGHPVHDPGEPFTFTGDVIKSGEPFKLIGETINIGKEAD